jgi:sucrose phosphorylase
MDLNAKSEKVWEFYDDILAKLQSYGAKMVRLDAFAYLHKEPGNPNFFNKPGTWEYLDRLRTMAEQHDLVLLPEIHSEFGYGLHDEVAARGFPIYDFFFPGLLIDALDRGLNTHLLHWIKELREKNIRTINMLGCHDGIPVLDLRGKDILSISREGLLGDEEIVAMVQRIMDRGGRVKNLYGPDGKEISYYQINATFFSALGEDERKFRLARAIQLFMPGIPQIWYLDLFAGRNDYQAADQGGTAGHKEINRTTLTMDDIEQGLHRIIVKDQLRLIKLRNSSEAFYGELAIGDTDKNQLEMTWTNGNSMARLRADLLGFGFTIEHRDENGKESLLSYL